MSDTVIHLIDISKQYRLGTIGTKTLRGDLQRRWYSLMGREDPTLKIGQSNALNKYSGTKSNDYIWALKDINLEVKKGEILGIIGKNGAGKSTLLKLLSRVSTPTTGQIKIKGRIASLLEVGTGFHSELTGRENIFLNGAILGMTKSEIRRKFDEIVDFAGVAKYIDTPVKRYSSGMYVRLAFAVAAHLEPDILIVDEVLAVGDAEFQQKAIGKMQDVSKGEGRTVLFVSHNMGAVKDLCSSALILKSGKLDFMGSTDAVISRYLQKTKLFGNSTYINDNPRSDSDILGVKLVNDEMKDCGVFSTNDTINVILRLKIDVKHLTAAITYRVRDSLERNVCTSEIIISNYVNKPGVYTFRANIPKQFLMPNLYSLVVGLHIINQEIIALLNSPVSFEVKKDSNILYQYGDNDLGCVFVNSSWNLIENNIW